MRDQMQGKTAIYLVLFLMSLILHIQFPIFTPYAVALGATSFFVSIMMSSSSLTNLGGHILAGPMIDRIGKKPFIVLPLLLASFSMMGHALVANTEQLLLLRIFNGFVLAFMSPACFALLSAYAKNQRQQGKNMAINGLAVTAANIISPLLGGRLVQMLDYRGTYWLIGAALFGTSLIALFYIKEAEPIVSHQKEQISFGAMLVNRQLLPIYFVGFALMYGNGTLFFELPFLTVEHGLNTAETGKLFSLMGIGTLFSLSLFWLNRFSAFIRTAIALLLTGLLHYQMATQVLPMNMTAVLVGMGMAFGLLFPALTTLLTEKVGREQLGSAFGILSAVFSLGGITSAITAGAVRGIMSPYFLAFLVTMSGAIVIGLDYFKIKQTIPVSKS